MNTKTTLVAIGVASFLLLAATQCHAQVTDGGEKPYEGADKWQHAGTGLVTAGSCTAVFKKPWQCFAASEAFGLAEQLYAIKTNPAKQKNEAGYDFIAHTIGAAVGAYGVNWYIAPKYEGVQVGYAKAF